MHIHDSLNFEPHNTKKKICSDESEAKNKMD